MTNRFRPAIGSLVLVVLAVASAQGLTGGLTLRPAVVTKVHKNGEGDDDEGEDFVNAHITFDGADDEYTAAINDAPGGFKKFIPYAESSENKVLSWHWPPAIEERTAKPKASPSSLTDPPADVPPPDDTSVESVSGKKKAKS